LRWFPRHAFTGEQSSRLQAHASMVFAVAFMMDKMEAFQAIAL
jgi:hypothetical protein